VGHRQICGEPEYENGQNADEQHLPRKLGSDRGGTKAKRERAPPLVIIAGRHLEGHR